MKGLCRYFQSPLRLAMTGLACFGAGVFAANLIGEAGLLIWWLAFAFLVLAVAGILRRQPVCEDVGSSNFEHVDKRHDELVQGWAYDDGPHADYYDGDRPYDISRLGKS